MSNVLVIGDTHLSACHPKYLQFCKDLYDEWQCDTVVHIGDLVDFNAISFHDSHPDLPGPRQEYELTLKEVSKWYKTFPSMKIMRGNHDERVARKAASVDIPRLFLRDYNEIWGTPNWQWLSETIVDDIYYFHGTGTGGLYPAFNKARSMGMSVVMGHTHASAGIWWAASPLKRFFGMNVGCGIDIDKLEFEYNVTHIRRPILAAGVVLDGMPNLEVMPIGKNERYYKRGNK